MDILKSVGDSKYTFIPWTFITCCLNTFLLTAGIIVLFAGPSYAGTYYVSPTGSSLWSACTDINTPCSWQTAVAQAIADDIVYFRGGTYEVEAECGSWQDVAMNPANSGTPGHPITFIAYPGETATIKACTDDVTAAAFGAHGRSYIVWDGFHASMAAHPGETAWLVYFYQATGSVIRNSHFTSVPFSEYYNNAPIIIETSDSNEVYNNHIEGCPGTGTNTAGVWIFNSDDSKIYQNTITNCANGIMQKDGPNNNIEIYNNFINVTAVGMNLNEQFVATGGLKVHNNVIINAATGINLDGTSDALTVNGYEVYNNTIYGGAMSILESPYARSLTLWNNLLVSPGTRLLVYRTGTAGAALPLYSDYNGFYGNSVWNMDWSTNYTSLADWRAATPYDDNSVTTAPGFVNAGGTSPEDYKRTSYPTNGRGGSYASVMGAYVTGNERIGYQSQSQQTSNQCEDGTDNDGDGLIDMSDPGCSSATDTDESDTSTPSSQNSPPSAPALVSPANGVTGLGATVEFRWKKSTDPDGDVITYQLYNCTDHTFAGCTSVDVAMNSSALFYAGGVGFFMIGMMFISGLTKRRRIVTLLVIVVLLAGGALLSCGTGGDSTLTPAPDPLPADEKSHSVTTLTPGTTYYWKVVADDGKGGTAESEVWSYCTQ